MGREGGEWGGRGEKRLEGRWGVGRKERREIGKKGMRSGKKGREGREGRKGGKEKGEGKDLGLNTFFTAP